MIQEQSGDKFQPEVGSDYSDDGDYDHHDDEHHHKGEHHREGEHSDEVKKEPNLKHISCLKNIHNESYCEGWKEATCAMKNRQVENQEMQYFTNLRQQCCDQAEWSRDWKSSCGVKVRQEKRNFE